ncbi:AMIN-like domain-containing (lipo)protein [Blastococcus sp. PRF04-17]|uniref:AMIN-like domain-containing (lipo)protein n=1 Tax=Blastococcus sp. PRF04-17 TaxID=2933797 RepID=UPI003F8D5BC2
MTVSDIRVGRHDGFDRVVFEVDGTGTPGWDVRYVDQAFSQGSGDAVDVAGDAVLQVTLTGAAYPFETGVEEFTGGPVRGGTDVVTEVAWDATFEGTSVAFVGTAATVPFRVYQLTGPTRVVVEVAHRG